MTNNDIIKALREARDAVVLKYYCQSDNRLATPLANACPELGRFLGIVGDHITQLEQAELVEKLEGLVSLAEKIEKQTTLK